MPARLPPQRPDGVPVQDEETHERLIAASAKARSVAEAQTLAEKLALFKGPGAGDLCFEIYRSENVS